MSVAILSYIKFGQIKHNNQNGLFETWLLEKKIFKIRGIINFLRFTQKWKANSIQGFTQMSIGIIIIYLHRRL